MRAAALVNQKMLKPCVRFVWLSQDSNFVVVCDVPRVTFVSVRSFENGAALSLNYLTCSGFLYVTTCSQISLTRTPKGQTQVSVFSRWGYVNSSVFAASGELSIKMSVSYCSRLPSYPPLF